MIINCRYNPFILRRCDSLLFSFFSFFFLQWHRESTTICLLINWRCLRCSSFAIYYAVFALCQNAAQTHCIISEGGGGGTGAELGSVWWLYTNWMYDCQLIMILIMIIIRCVCTFWCNNSSLEGL